MSHRHSRDTYDLQKTSYPACSISKTSITHSKATHAMPFNIVLYKEDNKSYSKERTLQPSVQKLPHPCIFYASIICRRHSCTMRLEARRLPSYAFVGHVKMPSLSIKRARFEISQPLGRGKLGAMPARRVLLEERLELVQSLYEMVVLCCHVPVHLLEFVDIFSSLA